RDMAEREKIDVRLYRVIYQAIEEIEAAMKGLLAPKFKEVLLGHASVRSPFKVSGVGTIAGSYVTDGKIARNAQIRLLRDNIVIHEGKISSLKRFKDDAKEVNTGYECGIGIERYNDIKEGDVIECFIMEEIER
ncbi:MAG: translation initiation factor IF-2, partial [Clostridia bacterium]|nr:translation initiation factor IF-2 [Clostridia bacterium]